METFNRYTYNICICSILYYTSIYTPIFYILETISGSRKFDEVAMVICDVWTSAMDRRPQIAVKHHDTVRFLNDVVTRLVQSLLPPLRPITFAHHAPTGQPVWSQSIALSKLLLGIFLSFSTLPFNKLLPFPFNKNLVRINKLFIILHVVVPFYIKTAFYFCMISIAFWNI